MPPDTGRRRVCHPPWLKLNDVADGGPINRLAISLKTPGHVRTSALARAVLHHLGGGAPDPKQIDGRLRRWQHQGVMPLQIIRGDATSPQAKGPKVVVHVCNDLGGWGKGFVLAISRRWPEPERAYRQWHRGRAGNDFGLGATQVVQVRPDTWVANMVAQHGMRTGSNGPPIRYDAVERCLTSVAEHAKRLGATVHMPRIGCGLAGGRWERIEPIVIATLCDRDVATTVYDYD